MLPLLTDDQVRRWFETELPLDDFRGQRVLLVIPDQTRTAPLPLLFDALQARLRPVVQQLDVIVALGTHPGLKPHQLEALLGITDDNRSHVLGPTQIVNHEWDNPAALSTIGTLTRRRHRTRSPRAGCRSTCRCRSTS